MGIIDKGSPFKGVLEVIYKIIGIALYHYYPNNHQEIRYKHSSQFLNTGKRIRKKDIGTHLKFHKVGI